MLPVGAQRMLIPAWRHGHRREARIGRFVRWRSWRFVASAGTEQKCKNFFLLSDREMGMATRKLISVGHSYIRRLITGTAGVEWVPTCGIVSHKSNEIWSIPFNLWSFTHDQQLRLFLAVLKRCYTAANAWRRWSEAGTRLHATLLCKRLNGSRSCLEWLLLRTQGKLFVLDGSPDFPTASMQFWPDYFDCLFYLANWITATGRSVSRSS